jgi:hypothetical protein
VATSPPERPAHVVGPVPPVASELDPLARLDSLDDYLGAVFYWVAQSTGVIVTWFADTTNSATDWLWWALYHLSDDTLSIGTQAGQGFTKLWDLVLRPIWQKLYGVLYEQWRLGDRVWKVAIQGVDYLADVIMHALLGYLAAQAAPLLALVQLVRSAGPAVATAANWIDSVEYNLGLKAWGALDKVRSWANLSAAWQSFMFHEKSVLREDPFIWSATVFHPDLQYILVESFKLPPEELASKVADAAAKWPAKTLGDWLADLRKGPAGDPPELAIELGKFRAGQ